MSDWKEPLAQTQNAHEGLDISSGLEMLWYSPRMFWTTQLGRRTSGLTHVANTDTEKKGVVVIISGFKTLLRRLCT